MDSRDAELEDLMGAIESYTDAKIAHALDRASEDADGSYLTDVYAARDDLKRALLAWKDA